MKTLDNLKDLEDKERRRKRCANRAIRAREQRTTPLKPFFTGTQTMKNYDYSTCWEKEGADDVRECLGCLGHSLDDLRNQ